MNRNIWPLLRCMEYFGNAITRSFCMYWTHLYGTSIEKPPHLLDSKPIHFRLVFCQGTSDHRDNTIKKSRRNIHIWDLALTFGKYELNLQSIRLYAKQYCRYFHLDRHWNIWPEFRRWNLLRKPSHGTEYLSTITNCCRNCLYYCRIYMRENHL